MGRRCISDPDPDAPVRLEWRTGLAGCLTPFVIGGAFLFLYWAKNPGAVGPDDMHGRGGAIVWAAAAFSTRGVGWGFIVLFAAMAWLAVQFVWRFVEVVAVTAMPQGLRMYGMFGRDVPWSAISDVIYSPLPRPAIEVIFAEPQPGLFNPVRHTRHRIAGVDTDNGAGARFVAAAERFRLAAR